MVTTTSQQIATSPLTDLNDTDTTPLYALVDF